MKTVFSATLFVVFSVGAFSVLAQQPSDQKSKSPSDNTQSSAAALSTAELAPKPDPTNAVANDAAQRHYDSGVTLADEGRLADAIESFKQSLKLRPDDAQTNFSLGMAYAKSKSYKEAFDSFKRVTRLKPDWAEGHFQLGTMSYVLGKRSQAIDEYKRLRQLNSSLAIVLFRIIKDDASSAAAEERVNANGLAGSSPAPAKESSTNGTAETENSANELPKNEETAKPTSSEAPLSEIYRVGVGDVLDIRLLNAAPGRSTLFTVIAGGLIDLPVAGGPISVGGLTIDEIRSRVSTELKRRAVDNGTQVSIGIRQYASHSVVVTGYVVNPGTKFLRREAVPLYVILAESQLRNDAGRVIIKRSGTNSIDLNLSDPAATNVNVLPGDVITVSGKQQEFYYIAGRVNYPGQKVFQPGITLLQAILAAGGTQRPNQNAIEISREGADSRLVTTRFNIKDIKAGRVEDPKLQPGDRIEVVH